MLFSLSLILITLSGVSLTIYYNVKNVVVNEVNEAVVRIAEESADHLGYYVDNYISPLKEIAENEQMISMDWLVQKDIIVDQINPNYENVAVVTLDGIAKYKDGSVLDLSDREYVKQVLSGESVFSEVIISRKTGENAIMAAVPIQKDKVVVGALIARLNIDFLSQFALVRGYGEEGRAYIISDQGSLISRSNVESLNDIYNLFDQSGNSQRYSDFSRFVIENKEINGGYGKYSFDHDTVLVGFAAIEGTNWKIYVGTYEKEALASLKNLKEIMALGMIFAVVLSVLAAWFFVDRFTKPIIELEHLFSKGAEGNLTIRFTQRRNDEIGRAGQSFNYMMDKIKTLTQFDPLTALLNQYVLEREVEVLVKEEENECFSLIMISVDNFRFVNETYGYKIGDEILCQIVSRVIKQTDEKSNVFRYKGDEFVIIRSGDTQDETYKMATKILDALMEAYKVQEKVIEIGISIGVFDWCNELKKEEPIKAVTHAKNYAKSLGGSRIQKFDRQIHSAIMDRYELQNDIALAIHEEQFFLLYQPLFYLNNEKISKMEALIRWNHPTRGLVCPNDFIELAEQSGQIIEIDMWVIETVCKMLDDWKKNHKKLIVTSVNITSKTFEEPSFIKRLHEVLKQYDIDPSLIQFEITERMVIKNVDESIIKLNELKKMGIGVSIDDFGIGYSSLSYIVRLPIDSIKIDRSFVEKIEDSEEAKAIITAIINFCKTLKLSVIAEGIEKVVELDYLKISQCDIGQGYYFSKPVKLEEIEKYSQ